MEKKKKHAHRKNNRETHSLLSLKISRLVLGGSVVKEPTCQSRRSGSMPGSGRFPWRKKWQPTPVLLPGKSHGQRSLMGQSPWGCKESDTTQQLNNNIQILPYFLNFAMPILFFKFQHFSNQDVSYNGKAQLIEGFSPNLSNKIERCY